MRPVSEGSVRKTDARTDDTERILGEEYLRVLKGLSLSDVALANCQTAVDWDAADFGEATPIPVTISDVAAFECSDGAITVRHTYDIKAKRGRKRLFYLKAEFVLKMAAADGFTEGFFDFFKDTSLPLVTWPYLRELVGSMTERMGLPRLGLGLWKTPFS